ncbi:Chloroperoxidase [Paramyrothecium foliicola]|nr:Chloroperoxidase [Paramyrothecium foliicola]
MQISQLLVFALAAPAIALPSLAAAPRGHAFQAPKSTDSRSPCPLLNSLANHGYLPRDGRNITVPDLGNAINAALNWSTELGTFPGSRALALLGVSVIDLEDLSDRPTGLEHVASLSRADDSDKILPSRVLRVFEDSSDPKFITPKSLGASRKRLQDASPPLTATVQNVAMGESALLIMMSALNTVPASTDAGVDYANFKGRKDLAYVLLTQHRLPYELGWKPSSRLVALADFVPFSAAVTAAYNAALGA